MKEKKARPKAATVPRDRDDTERRTIVSLLGSESLSALEISEAAGISEADVLDHLEHIRKGRHGALVVEPARCMNCGFIFRKREKLKGPGRCPVCRGEHIAEPVFSMET